MCLVQVFANMLSVAAVTLEDPYPCATVFALKGNKNAVCQQQPD